MLFFCSTLASFPVQIISEDIDADVKELISLNISIDGVNRSSGEIKAFVRGSDEYQLLLASGFAALALPNPALELARQLNDPLRRAPQGRYDYYSISEYEDFMVQTANEYPNICTLHNIGSSGQGRPLYFLKISDNPQIDEGEPKFRYISSIHGDEVVGYDMLIRLIQLLTSEYGEDVRITEIVNNTEIWVCPMINPDGFVAGTRYNASGIDLNRNFPMPSGNQHPDGAAWAPENIAVMNHANQHNFQLSANFHGGAQVINYPWDYSYELTPDDDLIHQAALTYSIHNSTIYNSSSFPQGVVNGAQWYVITGSLQDWSYGYTDCIDLTCEIANNKWPPASQLNNFWSQNKESILSLLEFVQKGVHGTVMSTQGLPLPEAVITVQGNAKQMHVGSVCADYHRLLLPGTYTITANAAGYVAQSAQITIDASGSANHDFVLRPALITELKGQLRNPDGTAVPNVQVILDSQPPISADADVNGSFVFPSVLEGLYKISFKQNGELIYQKRFELDSLAGDLVFVLAEMSNIFLDNFNSIANWTATSPWGITNYEGNSVLTDSPGGNYANNINKSCTLTNSIDLSLVSEPVLSFRTRYSLENNYDFVYLEASTDQNSWQQLASFTGSSTSWTTKTIALEQYAGTQVSFRFRIQTDSGVSLDGIFIDDFQIKGISLANRYFGDPDGDLIICKKDAQTILDYAVGLDPIPEIYPRPWNQTLVFCSDVDQENGVDATDAYLVMYYIQDPLFRFPSQSYEAYQFAELEINAEESSQAGQLLFSFDPAENLCAWQMQLLPVNAVNIREIDLFNTECLSAFNYPENKMALVKTDAGIAAFALNFDTQLSNISCNYLINGDVGSININVSSPNEDASLPEPSFFLAQNYPNPFNPSTTFSFSVEDDSALSSLNIYNIKGQLIRKLFQERLSRGSHQCVWDGKDDQGSPVSSGIYLYRLVSGKQRQQKKMVLSQ